MIKRLNYLVSYTAHPHVGTKGIPTPAACCFQDRRSALSTFKSSKKMYHCVFFAILCWYIFTPQLSPDAKGNPVSSRGVFCIFFPSPLFPRTSKLHLKQNRRAAETENVFTIACLFVWLLLMFFTDFLPAASRSCV